MSSGWRAATSCTSRERSRGEGGAAGGRARAAALLAALALAAGSARAEPQLEPVLRLGVEGGYDSNPLYDGRADERARVAPEIGLRLSDHLWDFLGVYAADYLTFRRIRPTNVWNHRGALQLDARPTPRTAVAGVLRGTWAQDPIGLAQAGIFREGRSRALVLVGSGRVEQDLDRKLVLGGRLSERVVRFEDDTGGAMHAPSVELLRRVNARLLLGGAYGFTVFQDFKAADDSVGYAQALRGRVRYLINRFLEADAYAGPAFWSGPNGRALVPEAGIELRLGRRDWDLRAAAWHGLGLGSTADPSLVNTVEVGTVRRFGRTFDLRGDGGLWHSGEVPSGRNSTLGVSAAGEAGWYVTRQLRLALASSYSVRLDDSSSRLRRFTFGVRMGWELPAR